MAQGQAVRFDAESDGATLATTGLFNGPWTVFCRARIVVDRNDYSTIFEVGDGGGSNYYQCGTDSSGVSVNAFGPGEASSNPYTATVGTWFDFAVTRSATETTVYGGPVGGTLSSGVGDAGPASTALRLYIGWSDSWGGEWFNGEIGGLKVWNTALTPAEITEERGYYRAVKSANLLGEYFMDGASLADVSPAGRNLTQGTTMPAAVSGPGVPYAPAPAVTPPAFFLSYM